MTRCLRLLLPLLFLAAAAAQAAGPRVVVRPLEVYNAADVEALAPGLQSMLASRLAGPGYAVETGVGREAGDEAWAVRTTITRLGDVYSIDAALEPVTARGDGTRTYETARSADALLPALEKVAAHLRETLARAPRETAVAAPTPAPAPAAAAGQHALAPPTSVAISGAGQAPLPSPPPSPLNAEAQLGLALRNHRTGPQMAGAARSLVVADADRDGTPEILLLFDDTIVAFRDVGGELTRAWDSPTPRGLQPKILTAGDVDGNGVPELFVAGMNGTRPVSQAMEWFGSALAPKGERLGAFVRAIRHPQRGTVLLGRVAGSGKDLFAPRLRSFTWTGADYREEGPATEPTTAVTVDLDWVTLGVQGEVFTLVTNQADTLEIYDAAGSRVFEGVDPIKGSPTFLKGEERVVGYQDEDFFRVHGRSVSWVGQDGQPLILTPKNHSSIGRIFQRSASFSHGQLLAYRWDGLTLATVAEGPKIPGYFPDVDLGPARPDGRTVYAALVQSEGTLFRTVTSRVVAYDLPAPGGAR